MLVTKLARGNEKKNAAAQPQRRASACRLQELSGWSWSSGKVTKEGVLKPAAKLRGIAALALGGMFTLMGALRGGDAYPPFSWERAPVYAHVGKTSDDFTSEELEFLAKHFDFLTIEKHQASHKHGSTEAGFAVAAREIKKRNFRAKVLFY